MDLGIFAVVVAVAWRRTEFELVGDMGFVADTVLVVEDKIQVPLGTLDTPFVEGTDTALAGHPVELGTAVAVAAAETLQSLDPKSDLMKASDYYSDAATE